MSDHIDRSNFVPASEELFEDLVVELHARPDLLYALNHDAIAMLRDIGLSDEEIEEVMNTPLHEEDRIPTDSHTPRL